MAIDLVSGQWQPGPLPPFDQTAVESVDELIPDAPWFWRPLEWCDVGCCGLEAYNFRAAYVSWAMGLTKKRPPRIRQHVRRPAEIGDLPALASELRSSAAFLDASDDPVVSSALLGAYFEPADLADLLRHLADAIDP